MLRVEVQRVYDEHEQVYGPRKVWKQLRREGIRAARCTVLASRVCPSGSFMNGLGCPSRDTGHRRVPAPPDRITGTTGWANEAMGLKSAVPWWIRAF